MPASSLMKLWCSVSRPVALLWTLPVLLALAWLTASIAAADNGFRELEWTDLMPDEDLQALLNPPDWLYDIVDGSEEDDIGALSAERAGNEQESRFLQALTSSEVRPELDGQRVRIPGYVVPLSFNEQRRATEFFLVPYFGACLHLPPPPPNQIIFVEYAPGVDIDLFYEPYWIEGVLSTSALSNAVADSAYRLAASGAKLYGQ
jgi:uncharacterized protein